MKRASSLPMAEHCGLAPELGRSHPTKSRASMMGDAFHALRRHRLGAAPMPTKDMDALTAAELREIEFWNTNIEAHHPHVNHPAWIELPVGLDTDGCYVATRHNLETDEYEGADGVEPMVAGRPDLAWYSEETNSAIVVDYKTGFITPEGGPLSLQLAAYGFALADMWGAATMKLGLYLARENRWWWEVVDLRSAQAAELLSRVRAAALSPVVAQPGDHCAKCNQRQHCPARLLPALTAAASSHALKAMVPFIEGPAASGITLENIAKAHWMMTALEDTAERMKEQIAAYVRNNGEQPIPVGDGKELYLVRSKRGNKEIVYPKIRKVAA